jgi:3-deoxy-manno-octulosonate cytidylyltransferase (CMP-KDO synthetase)
MTLGPEGFGVIIPARFASTRLPGKALLDLGGKPMVVRVLEVAKRSSARFTLVATDDERIAKAVTDAGGDVMLTSSAHASGTDRLAEAAARLKLDPESVVVNLQGDEPSIGADLVRQVALALLESPGSALATLATPITEASDVFDPNVVKVVLDRSGRALYFSRAPVPWHRAEFAAANAETADPPAGAFLRHIGLYAYRVSTLLELARHSPVELERAEGLEQLRALWLGLPIRVVVVPEPPGPGVDTEDDARSAQALFRP